MNRLFLNYSPRLHVIVGALLFAAVFGVSLPLSAYHYKIERDTAYSDLGQRQELVLDKIADQCTIPLATYDLSAVSSLLAASFREGPAGAVAFGVTEAAGVVAGHPSREIVENMIKAADREKSWQKYHVYPEGKFLLLTSPIELKRFDAKGLEHTVPLGRAIGVFSASTVERNLKLDLLKAFLIMAGCSLLGLGAAYWVLGILVVKPTQGLVTVTKYMARGNFDLPDSPRIASKDILIVWNSFKLMARQLGQASRQVEESIQTRTLELEKLSAVGRLVSSAGDELRNSLGAIVDAAGRAKGALAGIAPGRSDPGMNDCIGVVEKEAKSSALALEDLLQFARSPELDLQPLDVNLALLEILRLLSVPDNIEVAENLQNALPEIRADREKMKRVFMSLIRNVVQSMPRGGKLLVSTRLEAGSGGADPSVSVEFKGAGAETGASKGANPGYAVSQEIVKAHGGKIETTGEPGKSLAVKIQIPNRK